MDSISQINQLVSMVPSDIVEELRDNGHPPIQHVLFELCRKGDLDSLILLRDGHDLFLPHIRDCDNMAFRMACDSDYGNIEVLRLLKNLYGFTRHEVVSTLYKYPEDIIGKNKKHIALFLMLEYDV
jgi:hypothetical protein